MQDQESKVISVLTARLPEAIAALEKMTKKARRYGCADIVFEVGKEYEEEVLRDDWDGSRRKVKISYTDLIVEGAAPKVGDFEFLARIEFVGGKPVFRKVPFSEGNEIQVDERFRQTDMSCEHCNTLRNRKDVYVVFERKTGKQLQVGSSCLKDYLGVDPKDVVRRFAFWSELGAFETDPLYLKAPIVTVEGVVKAAIVSTRLFGWCSKSEAERAEAHGKYLTPTSHYVLLALNPTNRTLDADEARIAEKIKHNIQADDTEKAQLMIEWARKRMDTSSDYAYNLNTLVSNDIVEAKWVGYVASLVVAYSRAMDDQIRRQNEMNERAKSQYVGKVGDRLREIDVVVVDQRHVGQNVYGDIILNTFRDEAGNIYTWFTGQDTGVSNGERVRLTGTIKKHDEYNGMKQTNLTRCKVLVS